MASNLGFQLMFQLLWQKFVRRENNWTFYDLMNSWVFVCIPLKQLRHWGASMNCGEHSWNGFQVTNSEGSWFLVFDQLSWSQASLLWLNRNSNSNDLYLFMEVSWTRLCFFMTENKFEFITVKETTHETSKQTQFFFAPIYGLQTLFSFQNMLRRWFEVNFWINQEKMLEVFIFCIFYNFVITYSSWEQRWLKIENFSFISYRRGWEFSFHFISSIFSSVTLYQLIQKNRRRKQEDGRRSEKFFIHSVWLAFNLKASSIKPSFRFEVKKLIVFDKSIGKWTRRRKLWPEPDFIRRFFLKSFKQRESIRSWRRS